MTRTHAATLMLLALPVMALAADATPITVIGGRLDRQNVVCTVKLSDASSIKSLQLKDGSVIPAQVDQGANLVFVLPKLKADETVILTPVDKSPLSFQFVEVKGKPTELLYGQRPVMSYFNLPHDAADHFYTFKPFHHVYDPIEGKTLLTNGSAKTNKDGQFPHHRGLFFGVNKISYGDKQTADIWHGTDNVFSQEDKPMPTHAGPAFGKQVSAISWHGKDGKTFATEERSVTAYAVSGGTLIDWATTMKTELSEVKLDGDPQHAGFHFRASQEVSKNGKENTYYLRPDGKGKIGETRNWDAKGKDTKAVNLPWNAMSFVVGGKRYTVLRVNHPDNPGETRGSERDYGRFGDYFEYTLTPVKPLMLKYRVWVQEGEMTVSQCEDIARGFVTPPKASVGK